MWGKVLKMCSKCGIKGCKFALVNKTKILKLLGCGATLEAIIAFFKCCI